MPASGHSPDSQALATNRKARHDYAIVESWEAGIALTGPETKSCREGNVSLAEAYAGFDKNELFVFGMNIQPYAPARALFTPHDPVRPRKILMHRCEIDRLVGLLKTKGLALLPLKLYLARGKIKLQLGLGKGKLLYDKREALKKKTAEREIARGQ